MTTFASRGRRASSRTCQFGIETLESRRLLAGDIPSLPSDIGAELTTYRLALAATAEFTIGRGGEASTLEFMEEVVRELNRIYERDVAVSFELIPVVFDDPNTDGYTDASTVLGPGEQIASRLIDENQDVLDAALGGGANYDIGHVLAVGEGSSLGGGIAGVVGLHALGVTVVDDAAAEDATRMVRSLTAHEIGHQFGAAHSFNGARQSCGVSHPGAPHAVELGSGLSIMSYNGICGDDNLTGADGANQYFHTLSIYQIATTVREYPVSPNQRLATNNQLPSVDAGAATYAIPHSTPFTLTASASDLDDDRLTYTWEQTDSGLAPQSIPVPASADATGPLFRPFAPSPEPSRTFPRLATILAGAALTNREERLPTQARQLNFRVTVRDNHDVSFDGVTKTVSGVTAADVTLNVIDTPSPFEITSANSVETLDGGSDYTLTWNRANTDQAPISVSEVNVLMSTDGGRSFPIVLADRAPNTGSASFVLPNLGSDTVRFKVEAVGNVFFDLSNADVRIQADRSRPGVSVIGETYLAEVGEADTYSIALNTMPVGAITLQVRPDDQTSVSLNGVDFSSQQTITLTDTTPQTIFVRAIEDELLEGPHTSVVRHEILASEDPSSEYAVNANLSPHIAEIGFDNDLAPVVGVVFGEFNEGPENWTATQFGETLFDLPRDDGTLTPFDLLAAQSNGATGRPVEPESIPLHVPPLDAFDSFVRYESAEAGFEWQDLVPGRLYRAFVFGYAAGTEGIDQTVRIRGAVDSPVQEFVQATQIPGQLWVNGSVGDSSQSLDSFGVPVTANADGRVEISVLRNGDADYVAITGLAIQEVPEFADDSVVLGDSNRDGRFDSADFVTVFIAGEYEDDIDGNSTFEEGDWNGDGDFTSADLVAAFIAGNYEAEVMMSRFRSSQRFVVGDGRTSKHKAIDAAFATDQRGVTGLWSVLENFDL